MPSTPANSINESTIGVVGFNGTSFTATAPTAYSILCGATTSTGNIQNVASLGTAGQVLSSNGPSALPTWTTASGSSDEVGGLQYFSNENGDTYITTQGWLKCDGSTYSQATYTKLFSRLGLLNSTGEQWTQRLTGTFLASTYGTQYVVSNNLGGVYTSTDVVTWTLRAGVSPYIIYSLSYGNGLYFYGSYSGGLSTSTDAITWTARTSGTSSNINALTYGNGIYVYAGDGGTLGTSTDAVTWTSRTSGTSSVIVNLTYTNSLYIYTGNGGVVGTSTDAVTWSVHSSTLSTAFSCIYFSPLSSYFIGGKATNQYATTTDFTTFTVSAITTTTVNNSGVYLVYANNTIVATYNTSIYTSTNGTTWTSQLLTTATNLYATSLGYNGAKNLIFTSSSAGAAVFTSPTPYPYNPATQFMVPTESTVNITKEITTNYMKNLYIKALWKFL